MAQGARTRDLPAALTTTKTIYPAVDTNNSPSRSPGLISMLRPGMRVHMIGIGGCGMRGGAAVLLRRGLIVSGSDRTDSVELATLAKAGVSIHIGQAAENVPPACDLVVRTAAITDNNPEIIAARQYGYPILKYSQLLGHLMADQIGICLSGTHGKSTSAAMTTYVLRQAGLDPSFVIGANVSQLGGGSGVGDGHHFVVEACEYDRSFLNLRPRLAAILNIEEDHLDYYKDLDEIIEAFRAFAQMVPADGLLVVNGENAKALEAVKGARAKVETFGLNGGCGWNAEILDYHKGCARFEVLRDDRPMTEVSLAIPGRHNVANALAVMALCFHAGVEPETIAKALGDFHGADRRLTHRGCIAGVQVVDDYAHHPTELKASIVAAREYYKPRKLFVVFQPHQHSRTRFLLQDFATSFTDADVVIVPDIYFVRDSEHEKDLINAQNLVDLIRANGRDARYVPGFDQIVAGLCNEVQSNDLVITMGAGTVWQVADSLLKCLAANRLEETVIQP